MVGPASFLGGLASSAAFDAFGGLLCGQVSWREDRLPRLRPRVRLQGLLLGPQKWRRTHHTSFLIGSFSSVSTATIASEDAFCSIFRDLQDLHSSRDLNLQNFANFRQFIFQNVDKIWRFFFAEKCIFLAKNRQNWQNLDKQFVENLQNFEN